MVSHFFFNLFTSSYVHLAVRPCINRSFSGTGPHEERVPLIPDGDKPPQIRLPYPATLTKFKTRKRRRETAGSCLWVIGDHVDAWVNDRYSMFSTVFMENSLIFTNRQIMFILGAKQLKNVDS
jgi:hypothetical protein